MEVLITTNVLSVFILVFYNLYRIDEINRTINRGSKIRGSIMLNKLAIVNIVYLVVFTISVMVSLALLSSL